MTPFSLPLAVLTDSYKTTHPFIYPKARLMVAYGEMRQSYDKDPHDNRIVFYGIRYMYVVALSRPLLLFPFALSPVCCVWVCEL
jgi:hypothetical protein